MLSNSKESLNISTSIHRNIYQEPMTGISIKHSFPFFKKAWLVSYLHDYRNLQEKVCIL